MDLTVLILHEVPERPVGAPRSWEWLRRGAIVAVDRLHTEPISHPRMAALDVTGAPEKGQGPFTHLKRMRKRLLRPYNHATWEPDRPPPAEPRGAFTMARKRQCRFLIPELTGQQRAKLRNDRRITITWNYFRNRVASPTVTDPEDPTTDDDTVRVQDDEI